MSLVRDLQPMSSDHHEFRGLSPEDEAVSDGSSVGSGCSHELGWSASGAVFPSLRAMAGVQQLPLGSGGGSAYRADMHVSVLGPVGVVDNGVAVPLAGRKQRTVLALLAANIGKVVSVDALIDGVWGEEPTAGARSTLQTYVSNLRAAVGDVIVREAAGYRLAADPEQVDAVVFERAAARGADLVEADPAAAVQELRAALALWRGHPYADVAGSFPLAVEARRLDELRLQAVEARIDAELALDHHAELVAELEVLCEEFPFREGFRAQHMLALYRSGRQAEALRAFQKTRACLAEELGLEPSPRLQQLERQVLNQDASLLPELEPQVQTLAFLLTDVEDSTVLWELRTAAMRSAMAVHDRIVTSAVDAAGGRVVKRVGDGIDTVFADAGAAVAAAEEIQRGLAAAAWGETGPLHVRMAVDVGEVEARGGDYFGPVLNRAGRMLAAGHGGQVLLSADSHAALAATRFGWQAKALGEVRFKGIGSPQNVFQLLVEGLPADFPPLRIDRLPPPVAPAAFGRSIRGYELREQVGRGDFGVVYRAYQPSVGREVAIKVIRPELVNEPSFVRGFEAEARLVAQLEHPHVVSLYDYWRDPEGAYLVMRWLRGGSLRHALERGPWSPEPAGRLLAQVASALSYAHRQGVVHRDLKPANVLLDEEGHAYLSDFGIAARLADPEQPGRLVTSSPAYVPPEAFSGEPHTARSDLYGLGLLTFELLTGQPPPADVALPPPSRLRAELPAAVDAVIARATQADPDERYDSVDDFLAAFGEAVGTGAPATRETYTPAENPYKGLRAFGEADADDFHGRDSLVGELAAALGEHRLVAVVGPSGIGKSSVVRAGLIPALRAGALPGSERWVITDMFPGSYPFEELAAALLRVAVERPEGLVEALAEHELGIRRVLKQILPPGSDLLLVVDQFEELFTLTADEQVRRRFLDGLTALAADARAPVRVVVTLRADFFDHPLRYPEFGELVRTGMVAVGTPSDDELAQAIQGPAERVGVSFAPGLVSQIVADVRDQPGALPLLQYALTELFAARTSDLLTLEGYLAAGGVVGALGRRAEELYGTLGPHAQSAARQVFLRLVSVDAAGQDTRRPARRRELRQLELEPDALERILGRYGEHRLLSFDREPLTRSPTVEVAHEALLTQWERLRGWIEERREDLLLQRRLVEAVGDWDEAGRRPDHLPSEGRLAQFEAWAQTTDLFLTAGEREYLAEARATVDGSARTKARRRRALLVVMTVLLAVAVAAGAFALVLRDRAEDEARLATARQLAASSQASLETDPELSILLAIEAAETTRRHDGTVLPQAEEALHDAVAASRVLLAVPGVGPDIAFAPDGRSFVSADPDAATATAHDAQTGETLATLTGHSGTISAVEYSPDGRLIGTASADGTVRLWDAESASPVREIQAHPGGVSSLRFDLDGRTLATSGADGTARVWDARSGRQERVIPGAPGARVARGAERLAFLPRGLLAIPRGNDPAEAQIVARIVDLSSGKQILAIEEGGRSAPGIAVNDIDVSPDGGLLAAGRGGGQLELWRLPGGELFGGPASHPADVLDVEFSSDGKLLATASVDGTARIWEITPDGVRELMTLAGHSDVVYGVAFSRDGTRVVTSTGTVARVWDISAARGEVLSLPGPEAKQADIRFTPDGGRLVATSGPEGTVRIWSLETGEALHVLDGHAREDAPRRGISSIDVSPDGARVATSGQDGTARIYDTESGEELVTFRGHACSPENVCGVSSVAFSPDGSEVATAGSDGTVRIFASASGAERRVLEHGVYAPPGPFPFAHQVSWRPDGTRLLATVADGTHVWDARDGRPLFVLPPSGGPGQTAAWSPDGTRVLLEGGAGPRMFDAESGEPAGELTTGQPNLGLAFTSDGLRLAVGAMDGTIRIWDWVAGEQILKLPVPGPGRMAFSPDGKLLAHVGFGLAGSTVRVFALDHDLLLQVARDRVTRSLSEEECRRYLQRACSEAEGDGAGAGEQVEPARR